MRRPKVIDGYRNNSAAEKQKPNMKETSWTQMKRSPLEENMKDMGQHGLMDQYTDLAFSAFGPHVKQVKPKLFKIS